MPQSISSLTSLCKKPTRTNYVIRVLTDITGKPSLRFQAAHVRVIWTFGYRVFQERWVLQAIVTFIAAYADPYKNRNVGYSHFAE